MQNTLKDTKRVYYLSMEFLIGRHMQNALQNLRIEGTYVEALKAIGYSLETLYEEEHDPALGNGGLGRLAACFLDSLACLEIPAWGYGIRYNYGIFQQKIISGQQVEIPDYWLKNGNPFEIERQDVNYNVNFYGGCSRTDNRTSWTPGETVVARAFDNPIPGYGTKSSVTLRLWKSIPCNEFDFSLFNQGDYIRAVEQRQKAEYITSVLYPNDNTMVGKELRLKQQYFFVCATLQDVIRRFKKRETDWKRFPAKNAIQLNDTHPSIAIVELFRILIDEEQLSYEEAFQIVYSTFSYTNHTVLPEALEKWSVELMTNLLPRHMELIYLINHFFLEKVRRRYPDQPSKLEELSLIEESHPKMIRMANLSVVCCHVVNGVAFIHSELIKETLFKGFFELYPNKFQNKTNGVTPRRWIKSSNPELATIYDNYLKEEEVYWLKDLSMISKLKKYAEDEQFQVLWRSMKHQNKKRLTQWVRHNCGEKIDENSLFDIQVKRIHEYKRQLLNAFYIIYRYLQIVNGSLMQKRTCFFGGKAAPGYYNAKCIIKLINNIAQTVNNDVRVQDQLKVIFLPNYNVSNAQIIIPASDISQHISLAGTEASGTSNMKFVMNGGQIIGTMDGANVEIAEEVGKENMFIFGCDVKEVDGKKKEMAEGKAIDSKLLEVFAAIDDGVFGRDYEIKHIVDSVRHKNDWYLISEDFASYIKAQEEVDQKYQDSTEWTRRSILNALSSAKFSSDRTIMEYAKDIWNVTPCPF